MPPKYGRLVTVDVAELVTVDTTVDVTVEVREVVAELVVVEVEIEVEVGARFVVTIGVVPVVVGCTEHWLTLFTVCASINVFNVPTAVSQSLRTL